MSPLPRRTLPSVRDDRLFYAVVHEDPVLDIEALAPTASDTIVAVSSGGCTVLSLLAAGAGRVVAVDLNATQNHLVELKAAAVIRLAPADAIAFLGGAPASAAARRAAYAGLRDELSARARAYWDGRQEAVGGGVIRAGVSERFQALLARVIRLAVHPPARITRLLACRSLEEQRARYAGEWDTWRWRALFAALLNRRVLNRTYDPAFFRHVENPSFARHFLALAEHTLTELPVRSNYFLHLVLVGRYPADAEGGLPPYLTDLGAQAVRARRDRLELVDGGYTEALRTLPARSVHAFALSNICEWLDGEGIDALFAEIVRTAARGARLCFRNFVGWTEVPERWRDRVVEDRARGEAMIRRDRALVNRRIAVCRVGGGGGGS